MNREILFKAKRTDNKEWVEGVLTVMWGQYHIINPTDENTAYPINPETICQYTGLTDKNDKKIFEGDIVCTDKEDEEFLIEWDSDTARFTLYNDRDRQLADFDNYWGYELEVIANEFDFLKKDERAVKKLVVAGLTGTIYDAILDNEGNMTSNRTDRTDECIKAVAEHIKNKADLSEEQKGLYVYQWKGIGTLTWQSEAEES